MVKVFSVGRQGTGVIDLHISDYSLEQQIERNSRFNTDRISGLRGRDLAEYICEGLLDDMLSEEALRDFVLKYQKESKNERQVFLRAPGHSTRQNLFSGKKVWKYETSGMNLEPVQDWVDRMDAAGGVLYIAVSNPQSQQIHSKESLLVYPDGRFELDSAGQKKFKVNFYSPKRGGLFTEKEVMAKSAYL